MKRMQQFGRIVSYDPTAYLTVLAIVNTVNNRITSASSPRIASAAGPFGEGGQPKWWRAVVAGVRHIEECNTLPSRCASTRLFIEALKQGCLQLIDGGLCVLSQRA